MFRTWGLAYWIETTMDKKHFSFLLKFMDRIKIFIWETSNEVMKNKKSCYNGLRNVNDLFLALLYQYLISSA